VYNDMLACAWRREAAALPDPATRRSGLTDRTRLPDGEALAALVQVGSSWLGWSGVWSCGLRQRPVRSFGAFIGNMYIQATIVFGCQCSSMTVSPLGSPQAFAAGSDLRTAAKYYKQLRRAGRGALAAVAAGQRRMWEVLIEGYCRQHRVKQALQVGGSRC
jgi:hypothetical protein